MTRLRPLARVAPSTRESPIAARVRLERALVQAAAADRSRVEQALRCVETLPAFEGPA